MLLEELLDDSDHEVWFRIVPEKGKPIEIWSADYHGEFGPTMDEVAPFLDMEIVGDGFYVEMTQDPEGGSQRKVPIIVVPVGNAS